MRQKPAVIPEDVFQQLEVIYDACKAHGPGEIYIRCPFCGVDGTFVICNTEASAGGYCSACKKNAHIKWDHRHLPWKVNRSIPDCNKTTSIIAGLVSFPMTDWIIRRKVRIIISF